MSRGYQDNNLVYKLSLIFLSDTRERAKITSHEETQLAGGDFRARTRVLLHAVNNNWASNFFDTKYYLLNAIPCQHSHAQVRKPTTE